MANSRDFQKVAAALVLQHPGTHVRESRKYGGKGSTSIGKGKGRKKNGKFLTKTWKGSRFKHRMGKGKDLQST